MTRGDLLSRVGELLGDTSAETRALLVPWIGLVLQELLLHGVLAPDAEWAASTVAGQRAYQLPTDLTDVQSIRIPALDKVLIYLSPDAFDELLVEDEANEDEPEFWTLSRRPNDRNPGEMRLHPVPDEVWSMTLRGDAKFATLTDDADIIELHDKYLPAIVFGLYRVGARFDAIRDIPDAAAAFERAIDDIKFDQHGRETRVYFTRFNDL